MIIETECPECDGRGEFYEQGSYCYDCDEKYLGACPKCNGDCVVDVELRCEWCDEVRDSEEDIYCSEKCRMVAKNHGTAMRLNGAVHRLESEVKLLQKMGRDHSTDGRSTSAAYRLQAERLEKILAYLKKGEDHASPVA